MASVQARGNRDRSVAILIVSAFAPELAPLVRALRSAALKSSVAALPVGIGLVDAGIGAARAIERVTPQVVLFVGTAGSYGARPAIGQVAVARRINLASGAVARNEGYYPAPMPLSTVSDPGVRRRLLRAAGPEDTVCDAATPLAITRTAALAARLARATRAAVENLEVFAVARASREAGLAFGAVLGIANRVGPRGHEEWRRNQASATLAACGVVERFLLAELELTAPSRSSSRRRRPRRPQ